MPKIDHKKFVQQNVINCGIQDPRLIEAFRSIPREKFVPEKSRNRAMVDAPISIGQGQTISQPSLVAHMVDLLELENSDKALEIGAGSGYAAAILGKMCKEVYALERIESLADAARARLMKLGISNVSVIHADGTLGWLERAPYDAILVSAGAKDIPQPLLDQLKVGGRLVIPAGEDKREQKLLKIKKIAPDQFRQEEIGKVIFVPLIGEYGFKE